MAPRVDVTDSPFLARPQSNDAWLYHKSKTEVDVDSLLQATLPGPVEDEVDTYSALGLAGSE